MGERIDLTTDDGFKLGAYRAEPAGKARGGVVIMHEAFGMNAHIRDMCERYAAFGYLAVAPALYDRVQKGVEVPGYSPDDLEGALVLRKGRDWNQSVGDMKAAVAAARAAGNVGVVGYCWGGSLAWLAATRLGVQAAIAYYAGQIIQFVDERPTCPVMMHFAERDIYVPVKDIPVIQAKHPEATVYRYDANHGFNCDHRVDYSPADAKLAQERTRELLARAVG